jgi:hypothetical protein
LWHSHTHAFWPAKGAFGAKMNCDKHAKMNEHYICGRHASDAGRASEGGSEFVFAHVP